MYPPSCINTLSKMMMKRQWTVICISCLRVTVSMPMAMV
jgi:hypothetical protein